MEPVKRRGWDEEEDEEEEEGDEEREVDPLGSRGDLLTCCVRLINGAGLQARLATLR